MKIGCVRNQAGGALIVALFTAVVIGTVLGSFLLVVSTRNKLSVRSAAWNSAIPVLEAGIEEAFTHLHNDTNNYASNGWTRTNISGQLVFAKTRTLTSDGSYFYTTIFGAGSSSPIIYSAGFVPAPFGNGYISRTVKVPTTNPPTLFTKAIAAIGPISFGGSSVVDSFDSRIGWYDTLTNRGAYGSVATDSRANPAVSIGNGRIYGTVTTGPGGTITLSGSGAIGDVAWNAGSKGIEGPTWTNNDMNVAFPSNTPPIGPFALPAISLGGSNVMNLNTTNFYQLPSLNVGSGVGQLLITTNVTLWITGDFNVQGNGSIYLAPGASLKLYVGGRASINGGGLANHTGFASSFQLIGLSSNTSVSLSGGGSFVGTVNAPQADVTSSGNTEIFGAIICKTYNSGGGGSVHYDAALATTGNLIATGWVEL